MLNKLPKLPFNRVFIVRAAHATKTQLLYAVLFIQLVVKYAGVVVGNLFFFGGGEKREGKSSFADMDFGVGEAVCKCAFTVAVGYIVRFVNKHERI